MMAQWIKHWPGEAWGKFVSPDPYKKSDSCALPVITVLGRQRYRIPGTWWLGKKLELTELRF